MVDRRSSYQPNLELKFNIHVDYCPAVFTRIFDFVFNVITWSWLKIKITLHKRPLDMIIWRHAERMTCQVDQRLI